MDVEVKNFVNWLNDKETFMATQSGTVNKKLGADLKGNLVVYHNNEMVLRTRNPSEAVGKYNSIK